MACVPTSDIYQIKITLRNLKPPIWRRVLVTKDTTFENLHFIIIEAMGWDDTHMHEFRLSETRIGVSEYFDDFSDDENVDERKVKLSDILRSANDKIRYLYDFGDGWDHNISLEKILPRDPEIKYPACIAGKRACPPEDCGGIGGYYQLIEVMSDPNHPEHDERKEWLDDIGKSDWNQENFDHKDLDLAERVASRALLTRLWPA